MRKILSFLGVLSLLGMLTGPAYGKMSKISSSSDGTEKIVGSLINRYLEKFHYTGKDLDDSISANAFKEFIKKVDYGKQFLLKPEVDELSKFKYKMDDEMLSDDNKLIDLTMKIYKKRIKELDKLRSEVFKKEFNFKKKEYLELNPEKRHFLKTMGDLKEYWKKVYKQSVLTQYISLLESQKELKSELKKGKGKKKKKKNNNKKKKAEEEKILTDKEMRAKAHQSVNEKYEKVFTRLLKDERTDYLDKFFNSITSVYDPHTVYFPPKKKEDFDIDISGKLEGIGAVLQEDGAFIKVVRIVPGGAAWRQKDLEVDDIILSAAQGKGGTPVDMVNMRVDDAVRHIRGKKGTVVQLIVKKVDGSRKTIPITRDVVQIEASYAKGSLLEHKDLDIKVGYIYVPKFYRDFKNPDLSCTADVLMEIKRLKKQGISGMILDLRNNGGGALADAQQMSGLFIKNGPIVQVRGQGEIEVLSDDDPGIAYEGPLIVMVNRFSASASEILAGAMQDYKRAIIVGGEFTHGKGTVQAIFDFNNRPFMSFLNRDLGGLKTTVQKFYRITGASTQFKGITPDVILPDPMGYADNREQDLDYAIPWDHVSPKAYDIWKKFSYKIPILKERSQIRVSKNDRFEKIKESLAYLKKKKEETRVSLNLKEVLSEDKKNKEFTEKMKDERKSEGLEVTHFEESLMAHEKIRPGDKKRWHKDFEQRKEDWVKTIVQDPMIEETLFIMDDIIRQTKGKKLTMVKK